MHNILWKVTDYIPKSNYYENLWIEKKNEEKHITSKVESIINDPTEWINI